MAINKQNFKIDFLSLNLIKYIIVNGMNINNASYLTKDASDKHTKENISEIFVLFKNNANDEIKRKRNNVKLIPSSDISNNLGSIIIRIHPSNDSLLFVNLRKIE